MRNTVYTISRHDLQRDNVIDLSQYRSFYEKQAVSVRLDTEDCVAAAGGGGKRRSSARRQPGHLALGGLLLDAFVSGAVVVMTVAFTLQILG